MSMINYHPAPGLGDLLPGFYVVPQNPIQSTTYVPRIGEILPGSYAVPQNPIKDYMAGRLNLIGREPGVPGKVNGKPVGVSGCGCGGTCGGCSGGGGLGDISSDFSKISSDFSAGNYGQAIQDPIFGIPLWAIAGGIALLMFAGGPQHSYYHRARKAGRAARSAFA